MVKEKNELITLDRICGYKEEKKEIQNIVNLLKNYSKYESQGINIPRGLIFQGPPGTGKTLFAKAIAGECGYNFNVAFSNELEENSLDTLKKAFRKAEANSKKTNKPVLIYLDELDKLVYTNSYGELADKEAREAARFLLQKLDETKSKNKILIIASTNNYNKIPHALLRSGRFDKKLLIEVPDAESRKDILSYYMKDHPLFKNININTLALKTRGMSGADLKTLINNTLLEYVTKKEHIELDDFVKIINEMNFETIGKKWASDKVALETLAHEIGHELVNYYLNGNWGSVSAIRYGDTGGYTEEGGPEYESVDDEDNDLNKLEEEHSLDYDKIIDDISISLGGMAAEKVLLNQKSLGNSADLHDCRMKLNFLLDRVGFGFKISDIYFSDSNPESLRRKQHKYLGKIMAKQYKKAYKIIKRNKILALYLIKEIHINEDSLSGIEIKNRYDYFIQHKKEIKNQFKGLKVVDLK
jgi:cell division protease FtsH